MPAANHFTYTKPAAIEGEPADVAEIAIAQIKELASVVAELSAETFTQLQSAGMDPDAENAVAAWLETPDGRKASDLVWGAQAFGEVAKQLGS